MRFNSSQAPAEQERPVRTAACSRSFTAAGVTTAAPECAPEAVHGAPSLQTMTWTNCGDFAEDEEVRDVFVSLSEKKKFFLVFICIGSLYLLCIRSDKYLTLICLFDCSTPYKGHTFNKE